MRFILTTSTAAAAVLGMSVNSPRPDAATTAMLATTATRAMTGTNLAVRDGFRYPAGSAGPASRGGTGEPGVGPRPPVAVAQAGAGVRMGRGGAR